MAADLVGTSRERHWIYRIPAVVRLSHWLNALCLLILLMSGLQIFNAHPALYWGEDSDFDRPLFSISVAFTPEGRPVGITNVFGRRYDTTGVLGRSELDGRPVHRAFPGWLTLPTAQDLATGHRGAEYNVLQRVTYLVVVLVMAPGIVLTGLTMSPAVTAAAPWLLDLFGGRQSARSIHFVLTLLFVAFVLVHVLMVIASGFFSSTRSMITGWYATPGRAA
jgi:thiosulfate reductase cytochrome b subunit